MAEAHRSLYPWHHHRDRSHPTLQRMDDDRTLGERVADRIAQFGGSWPFIFVFLGLIFGWMLLNAVVLQRLLSHKPFDGYPFIALNLVLSALAGLQAPIIMMSQNRAAARDEALAAHHYDETQRIDQLILQNTELTQQVHELTRHIETLSQEVRDRVVQ